LEVHANVGNFISYTATRTQAHYVDSKRKKVKTSARVLYDEGMCDSDDPSPNARQMCVALVHPLPAESLCAHMPTDLDIIAVSSSFTELIHLSPKVRCENPCLGLVFGVCAVHSRAFIVDIHRYSTASKVKDWRRKYHGAYMVEINKHPVLSVDDASCLLRDVRDNAPHGIEPTFTVILSPGPQ
jgi:hypothetical protein